MENQTSIIERIKKAAAEIKAAKRLTPSKGMVSDEILAEMEKIQKNSTMSS